MTLQDEVSLLTVLVPAYREGPSIYGAVLELLEALDAVGLDYEVIIVCDGSTDDTAEQARRVASDAVRVVHYETNRGKGYALRHGFAVARGSHVAFIDADMELHPSGIGRLLGLMHETGADVVVGSKVHPESRVFYPRFRRLQSKVFRQLVRALFDLDVADTQTGLKVFRRQPLEAVMPAIRSEGFAFDLELLAGINDAGYRIVEGPVQLDYRFSTTTGVRAVVDVLADMLRIARRRAQRRRQASRRVAPTDAA